MANRNSENGKAYERRVIDYINTHSPHACAHKPMQPTWQDRGDVRFSTAVLQAKTSPTGTKTMLGYLTDAETQAARHTSDIPLLPVVIVRTSPDVSSDLVLLRAESLLTLIAERDTMEHRLYSRDSDSPYIGD